MIVENIRSAELEKKKMPDENVVKSIPAAPELAANASKATDDAIALGKIDKVEKAVKVAVI